MPLNLNGSTMPVLTFNVQNTYIDKELKIQVDKIWKEDVVNSYSEEIIVPPQITVPPIRKIVMS